MPFTVIGVTPPGFDGPLIGRAFDVAVPLRTVDVLETDGAAGRLDGRSMWWLDIIARLKDGQSIEQATAALRAAQLAAMGVGATREPYYWAGFVFQGDWRGDGS